MKLIILALSLFCACISLSAQMAPSSQAFISKKCKLVKISLHASQAESVSSDNKLFSPISVIDCREDSSRIGLALSPFATFAIGPGRRKPIEINFSVNAGQELANYLNIVYAKPSGERSLLVVIRKLWLYDSLLIKAGSSQLSELPVAGKIIFRTEAYLKQGEDFIPLTYLDTIVGLNKSVTKISYSKITDLLSVFMNKVNPVALSEKIKNRKPVSFARVSELRNIRGSYLIDTTAVLKKGVYTSLKEFRNNTPSISNYKIETDKDSLCNLYLQDEKGGYYYSRTAWGYCDGQLCYAMMSGSLFPMLHINNAFYIWGSKEKKEIYHPGTGPSWAPDGHMTPGSGPYKTPIPAPQMNLFKLDLETGEIY